MVFDGADTIDHSEASDFVDIRHLIPDVASLQVIITSRSSTAADMTLLEGVQVGEMEEAEAMEPFHQYSRLPRDVKSVVDEIRAVVEELGRLALAVTLAAAYVGMTPRLQSDITGYLPEFRQRRRELLCLKPENLVHQYNKSVLTTWETSHRAVAEQCPEAAMLMTILSFLSFDDIFLGLFDIERRRVTKRSTDDEGGANWRCLISPGQTLDKYKTEECFRMLQKYSLVQWKEDQQSYAIHKLVHAWGYDRLTSDEYRQVSRAAFDLVIEEVGAVDNNMTPPQDKLRVVPHVMANFTALVGGSRGWNQVTEYTLEKLELGGSFFRDVGRLSDERAVHERVLAERRRIFGEEHPDTISAMSNLASTFRDQGHFDEAATMKKEVLEKSKRILGEEHPDTVSAMSNLTITLRDQGHLDKAATMKKEVLEKRKRILGEEHPNTFSAMNNLANTLSDQGHLDEAATMFKEVLEKRKRILGKEHPDTISAMSNLANTLSDIGHFDEAATV